VLVWMREAVCWCGWRQCYTCSIQARPRDRHERHPRKMACAAWLMPCTPTPRQPHIVCSLALHGTVRYDCTNICSLVLHGRLAATRLFVVLQQQDSTKSRRGRRKTGAVFAPCHMRPAALQSRRTLVQHIAQGVAGGKR